jgi:periplasmic divalent cation tolerance protein
MSDVVIVLTTVPSPDVGEQIARAVVQAGLAACVNVLPPMVSVYRWKGVVQREMESQLVIKTVGAHVDALQQMIEELHPYDLPEFMVIQVEGGDPAYLAWIATESSARGD